MAELSRLREALIEIDVAVHNLWNLGHSVAVGWTADEDGILVCLAPCQAVLRDATLNPRLLEGSRMMDEATFRRACKDLKARVLDLPLPCAIGIGDDRIDPEMIDSVVRRYSVVRTEHRAVMLFDIAGFATASPIQQVCQFVSLERSISTAVETMAAAGMPVELARSTAGDGYLYVWNRASGFEADLRTYAALFLILTDNAEAHRSAGTDSPLVPVLRTSFTVGSHYSYHQVEANRPRTFEYATGQVTITLARLVAKAKNGQIMVGAFQRPFGGQSVDAVNFMARAETLLRRLVGARLDECVIQEIHPIISGGSIADQHYGVAQYRIADKHGFSHDVFNVRAKVACRDCAPFELGLRTADLVDFDATPTAYEIPIGMLGARPPEACAS